MSKLIKCKDCGNEMSKKAKKCPQCGAPAPRSSFDGCMLVIFACVLVFGGVIYLSNKHGDNSSTPKTPPAMIKVSCSKLVKDFGSVDTKLTDLQMEKEWEKYKGKRVKWTARVVDVDETFSKMSLRANCRRTPLTYEMSIFFGDEWKSDLLKLKKKEKVTFIAELEGYGKLLGLRLRNGEIVEYNK